MSSSGAQLLSTDYPYDEPGKWPGHFSVSLPGHLIARCDPINTTSACNSAELTK